MVHLTEGLDYLFRLIGKKPLTEVYIIFRSSLLANKLSSDVAGCEGLSSFSCCQMTPEIEQVLQSVISYSPYTPAYRLYAEAKAMELIALYLAELDRQNQTVSLATASSKYQRQYYAAKNYLDRHFCTPPTIEELSHIVGLNRRQLSEGFKLSFGKTIYQYSQSLRMEKAKFLLRDPQENISSVAEQLGYHYQSNFTKAFLRYVGVRPKEFFNIQKANHLKE